MTKGKKKNILGHTLEEKILFFSIWLFNPNHYKTQ